MFSVDDSSCGADRILGSNQSAHNPMSPHSLYIYLHKNPFTHESCVALKKTPRLSLPFFGEGSLSHLQWDGKGVTTGAGRRRGQPGVLYHQTQRSSCLRCLSECYSGGIKFRFEAGFSVVWMFAWIETETLHTICIFIFFSTVFSRHEKNFLFGKGEDRENRERTRKGLGYISSHGVKMRYPGTPVTPQASSIVS